MNIFQLNKILLEFNLNGNLTTLSGQDGIQNGGKNLDNIATGVSTPYKTQQKKPTENEKRFPNLAKLVNQMKQDSLKGDKIVIGAALYELIRLVQQMNLRKDENGEMILPFGNNVRLIQRGNNFFIKLNSDSDNKQHINIF